MRKSNVDAILVNDANKRKMIIFYVFLVVAFLILGITFIMLHVEKNQKEFVSYSETSDIKYKVFLKKNDFFENDYAEEERQYIASLIDYINADFEYNINISRNDVDYKYSYSIDAKVDVKEKNSTKSLYTVEETILPTVQEDTNSKSSVSIFQNVKIDYNRYNSMVEKLIYTYKLTDTVSTLTVNMHVRVVGSCEDFSSDHSDEAVISLVIPLTTKTMAIDMTNDLVDNNDNILVCKQEEYSVINLILAIIMLLISVTYLVLLVVYVVNHKTAKDIYERELKKILNNYHSYIQKINNDLRTSSYEKLYVDTFTDMLEIRDVLQQPILMVDSEDRMDVNFMIPSNTRILYVYSLKVSDIRKKMENNK